MEIKQRKMIILMKMMSKKIETNLPMVVLVYSAIKIDCSSYFVEKTVYHFIGSYFNTIVWKKINSRYLGFPDFNFEVTYELKIDKRTNNI